MAYDHKPSKPKRLGKGVLVNPNVWVDDKNNRGKENERE
ncbi:hypothetical protein A4U88_2559 [Serratia marcescens]|nr:hypothetical protein A4U88_2559 [Serratia marcescens]